MVAARCPCARFTSIIIPRFYFPIKPGAKLLFCFYPAYKLSVYSVERFEIPPARQRPPPLYLSAFLTTVFLFYLPFELISLYLNNVQWRTYVILRHFSPIIGMQRPKIRPNCITLAIPGSANRASTCWSSQMHSRNTATLDINYINLFAEVKNTYT